MTNKAGFYWHVHHNTLIEWCYDEQERIDYIKKRKPANERETRLKWMKPVKGKLPRVVVRAWKACCKARDTYWEAYCKAGEPYHKAGETYDKAIRDHKDEIEALHAKEQPGCPWNGSTLIFPT